MIKKLFLSLFLVFALTINCFAGTISKVSGKQLYKTTLGADNDEVIIGDEKSSVFVPQIEVKKWKSPQTGEYENSLIIKPSPELQAELSSAVTTFSGNKIEHKAEKIGWYANPDPDNGDNFKFGIIWKEKPASNSWSVKLSGYEDLDIIYQPPLSKDNPTGRKLRPDGVTYFDVRPENVVGSYAIYHKWKANHEIGKVNYGTGKLFHWYRPKFIDAEEKWTWGVLEYKDGLMTETCPWEFLDDPKTVYPVESNVDVGYKTGGASSDYIGTSQIWAAKVNGTNANAGTLNILHVWCNGSDNKAGNDFALYSDSSDKPVTRLAIDNDVNITTLKSDFASANLNYAISVATQFWIGVALADTSGYALYVYWDSGTDHNYFDDQATLPTTWTDYTYYEYTSVKNSVYFSYTAGGAARRIIFIE